MGLVRNIFVFFCIATTFCQAQPILPAALAELLQQDGSSQAVVSHRVFNYIKALKPGEREPYLQQIRKNIESNQRYLSVRSALFLGRLLPADSCKPALQYVQSATYSAIEMTDSLLTAEAFFALGELYNTCGPNEKAIFYLLKCNEIIKGDSSSFPDYLALQKLLGGILFRMQEYKKSISFSIGAIATAKKGKDVSYFSTPNLIAISYQRLGLYDSAFYWYQHALQKAVAEKDTAWTGIINGNIGYLYQLQGKFTEALPLLWMDYRTSIARKDNSNAGNSLQRIATIYLALQKKDSADSLAREAYRLVSGANAYYNPNHPMQAALTLSNVLGEIGKGNEALTYYKIYHRLSDSLSGVLAKSRLDVVDTQLGFEKALSQKNALLMEQKNERIRRYWMAGGVLLLAVIGWLMYQRKIQEQLNARKLLAHENTLAQAKVDAAMEQLSLFTQSIVDKNELIEQLTRQALANNHVFQPEELVGQTILTDEDWMRFKNMFEKVYPGFFEKLQQMANDVTQSELRMAALIRISVGNKHIASMLGVSVDTVRKTKSRLRQRLNLAPNVDIESFIALL